MVAAGLVARNAVERGIGRKPWVKSSLAPGSKVVTEYYEKAGLTPYLEELGFHTVGYGCTTCIGNSGPLPEAIADAVTQGDLVVASVLSGNRNFEARVHQNIKANFLMSPPLVVAFALAGTVAIDLTTEPLGQGADGKPVYLRDLWPSNAEIDRYIRDNVTRDLFRDTYANVFSGDEHWRGVDVPSGETYKWDDNSTYVRNPPYFVDLTREPKPVKDIVGARILALFGDKITTDHISPAGSIKASSPAGKWLLDNGVAQADFNQYGTRRGNHEVMMRGTFANIRIKNHMMAGPDGVVPEGGLTRRFPGGETLSIYDAAMRYQKEGAPLVVFAGAEYGNGSSRDWAAKGTALLGVRAVIAQSFERIHRSNLVGMGVLPLTFETGTSWMTLGLTGAETVAIRGLEAGLTPRQTLVAEITFPDGKSTSAPLLLRIDTLDELEYFRNGGILPYVLRQLASRH
jgi:aconitate hydratase